MMNAPSSVLPHLLDWLGAEGVRAGLKASKRISVADLRSLVLEYGINFPAKANKSHLIDLLILHFDKRIQKSASELKAMHAPEIVNYLESIECSKEEVQLLLKQMDIPFRMRESRTALIRLAAERISNLGMYQRIAGQDDPGSR